VRGTVFTHVRATHERPGPQTVPQAPQPLASVWRLVSQPFIASPSQLPKPAAQVSPHAPAVQVAVALGPVAHARPQAPQCAALPRVAVSQPFIASPSQSPKPASQVRPQRPAAQVGRALASAGHTLPHAPHSVTSDWRSTHDIPQRVWAAAQPDTQTFPVGAAPHTGVAPEHARPQAPQLPTASSAASQPLIASLSQSAKPGWQVIPQRPPAQLPAALARAGHAAPQAPQLAGLVLPLTSQPLLASMSQSRKPGSHAVAQRAIAHDALAPGPARQAVPQAPQCIGLVAVLASQPLAALPSQSAKPMLQVRPQLPAAHAGVALVAPAHIVVHVLQAAGLLCVSTQVPAQHA